ncbi:hypothetical protein WICMUC_001442 [Wickerhamomyces mucosus]|uniref:Uncharacterized protein n=1 Tax=Wickerhamomyces mucosus TaxID=1378264 RepID=A0A9P8TH40_9ASCO|nr:hypothetical protein WICMUC_001442 [Wickerhamomyces mucosus]
MSSLANGPSLDNTLKFNYSDGSRVHTLEGDDDPRLTQREVDQEIQDEEEPEVEEFIKKYGEIKVSYINPPTLNPWFTKPYALNYFFKGKLFRTRHERTSGKLELFLDLIYVGIVANLASSAVEEHTGLSFLKFFLLFIPAWTVWCDLKEFMNYYYNEDLLQRILVIWTICLLVVYDNNCEYFDELDNHTARVTTVLAYFLARISFGIIILFYSIFIREHRLQMRMFSTTLLITSSLWWLILLIHNNWGRCIFAAILFSIEQLCWVLSIHPWTKKKLKLEYSTALNIEHEDERFQSFYIIAVGEFLYNLVADSELKQGWNKRLSKGLSVIIISFLFLGFYAQKDGCRRAVHALRRSALAATLYVYSHLFLIASLLITGDAGVDLAKYGGKYLEHEEFGLLIFFHSGILVTLSFLTLLACLDKEKPNLSDCSIHSKLGRVGRIGFRIPVGCLIFGLSWAYKRLTIEKIMWMDCVFLIILFTYEFIVMNPLDLKEFREQFNQEEV